MKTKLIVFSLLLATVSISQAASISLHCQGRFESADPNNNGYTGDENVHVSFSSFNGANEFQLQKHRDRWNLGGGSRQVRPFKSGDYILFRGETQQPLSGSLIGQTLNLTATGSVEFVPNFGPFPYKDGKTVQLGTLKLLTSQIAVLTLDNKDIGLTCTLLTL